MKGRIVVFHLLAIAFWVFAASYAAEQSDTPVKAESSSHESHTATDPSKSSPPASGHESDTGSDALKTSPPASGHESHTGSDPSKASTPSDADKAHPADHDMSKDMQMMEEHLKKMDANMEKIRSAADPQERHKLMQEHIADMKEGMKMMKNMPGCKMMSGGGMMKEGHEMGMGNMMMCHKMMEMKMKMMQSIVEGTLESSQMAK